MAKTIGRNINTTDLATQKLVTLNATTSTTVLLANLTRIYVRIDNPLATSDVFIKLQAASVDDLALGIFIVKRGGFWEMPSDNIYTGEISAITASGATTISVTEY